ncbi:MAG: DUF4430 domain-containing protein [Candidatus Aenigmarchaeota archaeon]|nr:DUF4430 domain-containing protein [Candidatus Aenigmarchaeota archaeon]
MVISSLMLAEKEPLTKTLSLAEEDIELSLRSLQSLLEDLMEDGNNTKKQKKTPNKTYDETGTNSLFYGDADEDPYEEGGDEEEGEYPTVDNDDQEKIKELAKKSVKQPAETHGDAAMETKGYEKAGLDLQRMSYVMQQNNMNYPSDKSFESIIFENSAHASVYDSFLGLAARQNLRVESETYETWGGGGRYIVSVNGVRNGDNGYFWEYIVDGKIPDVSADKYQLQGSGEIIELRRLKKEEIKC